LRILARLGVKLLEVRGANAERVTFGVSLAENVAFADWVAARLWVMADEFIARQGIEAPEAEPDLGAGRLEPVRIIELGPASVDSTSIIWCIGFTGNLSWVRVPVLDDTGNLRHDGCASPTRSCGSSASRGSLAGSPERSARTTRT
jgi:putative flavoprotein involved in K+ transport